jgi:hypothetical protein
MALFLTILEGDDPDDARPLLASRDERLIGAVASELAKRFSLPAGPPHKTLASINRKLRSVGEIAADKEDPRHG